MCWYFSSCGAVGSPEFTVNFFFLNSSNSNRANEGGERTKEAGERRRRAYLRSNKGLICLDLALDFLPYLGDFLVLLEAVFDGLAQSLDVFQLFRILPLGGGSAFSVEPLFHFV